MNLTEYGFQPTTMSESDSPGIPARITAVHRGLFEIVCDAGMGTARLKAGCYRDGAVIPTVGDFVQIDWAENGESRILKTLPRRTCFTRRDPDGKREQAVAANFDYVFILQALGHDFNESRLERYLTMAWQSGAVPAVLLAKADETDDCSPFIRAAERVATGVGVFAVSARTGQGLDQLESYLMPGRTIVLLGSSGVGKSTLINRLAGAELTRTGAIRQKDGRGRHTTTARQLFRTQGGVMIIDTPGMRELGLWEADTGLEKNFADVEQYLGQCKFSDCRHQGEPGCAVASAIQNGQLAPERWESYQKLRAESDFTADKADYLRQKRRRNREIALSRRAQERPDYRHTPCTESFTCKACGAPVYPEAAGTAHRNHCPHCLCSLHVDHRPGDRASLCGGIMEPIGVWVRKNGEWAIIHRCRTCGALSSNRIAADDNPTLLMSIAAKPIASPPFPLWGLNGTSKLKR